MLSPRYIFIGGGAIAPLAPPGIDATVSVEILPIATQQCIDTTCMTGPEEIEVMKLEGYSRAMRNTYVQSTYMTRSSSYHCPIGPCHEQFLHCGLRKFRHNKSSV